MEKPVLSDKLHYTLTRFRQSLHQNPELSGQEEFTAEAVKRVIIRFQPDDVIDSLGGYGVAFVFNGVQPGPSILFRADMDAMPIMESNSSDYASRTTAVSHACGHDGHMAIMVGLAQYISENRPAKGRAILLFQPAEETGEGAYAVLNDPNFSKIEPDYCFSLHNIPGYPKGQILIKPKTFTAASRGLVLRLNGKTSHAAEPHKGKSPALTMSRIIEQISTHSHQATHYKNYTLSTIVYAKLGERTFGTSPGHAEVFITLRAFNTEDMQKLRNNIQQIINVETEDSGLEVHTRYKDIYPITKNDVSLASLVGDLATKASLDQHKLEAPFNWAEDFAQFSQKYKSFMFGLGAGIEHPQLHNADYDFPDEIIPAGWRMYVEIYNYYLNESNVLSE